MGTNPTRGKSSIDSFIFYWSANFKERRLLKVDTHGHVERDVIVRVTEIVEYATDYNLVTLGRTTLLKKV